MKEEKEEEEEDEGMEEKKPEEKLVCELDPLEKVWRRLNNTIGPQAKNLRRLWHQCF
jgi:hypothetical protein